jgi:hypothetical protein
MDRRRFLQRAGLTAAAVASLSGWELASTLQGAAAQDRRRRPRPARLGCWPGTVAHAGYPSRDSDEVAWWEEQVGRSFGMYRERGRVGQFDAPIVKRPQDFLRDGQVIRRWAGNLNFRTGTGTSKRGVLYTDVLAGTYDDLLAGFGAQLAMLGRAGLVNEIQSEANIVDGTTAPYAGTPSEYRRVAPYVRERLIAAGGSNVRHGMSLTVKLFQDSRWHDYYWPETDFIAVDGYCVTGVRRPNMPEDFLGAIDVARKLRKRLYIAEVGVQEKAGDPSFKPNWYRDFGELVHENLDVVRGVVFNLSSDGAGGWHPMTSPASLEAFRKICARSALSLAA